MPILSIVLSNRERVSNDCSSRLCASSSMSHERQERGWRLRMNEDMFEHRLQSAHRHCGLALGRQSFNFRRRQCTITNVMINSLTYVQVILLCSDFPGNPILLFKFKVYEESRD